jgi:hypothetical protein
MVADRQAAAQLRLQIGAGAQVIGMDMGFEYPLDLQALAANMFDNAIRRLRARAA